MNEVMRLGDNASYHTTLLTPLTPHLFCQVCQAVATVTGPALHRPQVSGAPLLLQAHWRHAHRHLPNGDARSPSPDDTPLTPCPASLWLLPSFTLDRGPILFKKTTFGERHIMTLWMETRFSFFLSLFASFFFFASQWIPHVYGSVFYLVQIYK